MDDAKDRDQAVEDALYKRALGFTVTETKTEISEKGEKTVCTVKEIPPDFNAQMTWLKHRLPERWDDSAAGTENQSNLFEALGLDMGGNT